MVNFQQYFTLFIIATLLTLSTQNISNQQNYKNLKVLKNTFQQFRAVGQAYRDESVEQDLTFVKLDIQIKSKPYANFTEPQPFDLIIFTNTADYECYIQATILLDQKIAMDCAFLQNTTVRKLSITEFSYQDELFLKSLSKYNDFFFVIDNTDFPMFPPKDDNELRSLQQSNRQDVQVDVSFNVEYSVNEEYTLYVFIAAGVGGFLLLLLIILIFAYKSQKRSYAKLAQTRRNIREEKLREQQKQIRLQLNGNSDSENKDESRKQSRIDGSTLKEAKYKSKMFKN